MTIIELGTMLTISSLAASWRFPALRWQSVMLAGAMILAWWTANMDVAETSVYRIIYDTVCVIGAGVVYAVYKRPITILFLILNILCIAVHALYFLPPMLMLPSVTSYGLTAALNVLFFLMLGITGGAGYVRCHSHIVLPDWLSGIVRRGAAGAR